MEFEPSFKYLRSLLSPSVGEEEANEVIREAICSAGAIKQQGIQQNSYRKAIPPLSRKITLPKKPTNHSPLVLPKIPSNLLSF
jgi:hypothetical protein